MPTVSRIKTTIKLSHATDAGFNLFGQRMIGYDMNSNTLNGRFYSPQDPTSMELSADIYIDRTSIEVFIDGGLYSYSMERRPDTNNREGFHFWGKPYRSERPASLFRRIHLVDGNQKLSLFSVI